MKLAISLSIGKCTSKYCSECEYFLEESILLILKSKVSCNPKIQTVIYINLKNFDENIIWEFLAEGIKNLFWAIFLKQKSA